MTKNIAKIVEALQKGNMTSFQAKDSGGHVVTCVDFEFLDKAACCENRVSFVFDADDFLESVEVTLGKKEITVTTHETELSR